MTTTNNLKVIDISKQFSGYGHNKVSIRVDGLLVTDDGEEIEVDNHELTCTSTNTMATDSWFDEYYDDDSEGRYYESREEAGREIVSEVLQANNIISTFEIEC